MDTSNSQIQIPATLADMDVAFFNRLVSAHTDVMFKSIRIEQAELYGSGEVSTAARARIVAEYREGQGGDLPTNLVLKFARHADVLGEAGIEMIYRNEVRVYNTLLPELDIERPQILGAAYDPDARQFVLLMEDLCERGARFRDSRSCATLLETESLLDQLAALHAKFWRSPRFAGEARLFQTHVDGHLAEYMTQVIPDMNADELAREPFKRELLSDLGISIDELEAGRLALHRHQATLPQTFLHGDPHIGNTYALPDERSGLLDWQLSVRGYCMHDVSYAITTALPIGERRRHDRALLRRYLDRLAEHGVTDAPSFEEALVEFGRALIWALTVGWLPVPIANYGWQVNVCSHLRVAAAFRDYGSADLLHALLDRES